MILCKLYTNNNGKTTEWNKIKIYILLLYRIKIKINTEYTVALLAKIHDSKGYKCIENMIFSIWRTYLRARFRNRNIQFVNGRARLTDWKMSFFKTHYYCVHHDNKWSNVFPLMVSIVARIQHWTDDRIERISQYIQVSLFQA